MDRGTLVSHPKFRHVRRGVAPTERLLGLRWVQNSRETPGKIWVWVSRSPTKGYCTRVRWVVCSSVDPFRGVTTSFNEAPGTRTRQTDPPSSVGETSGGVRLWVSGTSSNSPVSCHSRSVERPTWSVSSSVWNYVLYKDDTDHTQSVTRPQAPTLSCL